MGGGRGKSPRGGGADESAVRAWTGGGADESAVRVWTGGGFARLRTQITSSPPFTRTCIGWLVGLVHMCMCGQDCTGPHAPTGVRPATMAAGHAPPPIAHLLTLCVAWR